MENDVEDFGVEGKVGQDGKGKDGLDSDLVSDIESHYTDENEDFDETMGEKEVTFVTE